MKDYNEIKHLKNLNNSMFIERMNRAYDYGYARGYEDAKKNLTVTFDIDALLDGADAVGYRRGYKEAQQKTGHWEYGYAFADGNYCKCSECKEIIKCIYPMHYCPNCGAKMESEE